MEERRNFFENYEVYGASFERIKRTENIQKRMREKIKKEREHAAVIGAILIAGTIAVIRIIAVSGV